MKAIYVITLNLLLFILGMVAIHWNFIKKKIYDWLFLLNVMKSGYLCYGLWNVTGNQYVMVNSTLLEDLQARGGKQWKKETPFLSIFKSRGDTWQNAMSIFM